MSKRPKSSGATNTIFNYFNRTPPANKSAKTNGSAPLQSACSGGAAAPTPSKIARAADESRKRERQPASITTDSSDEADETSIVPRRRKRIRINPSDYDPDAKKKDAQQLPGPSGLNNFEYKANRPASRDQSTEIFDEDMPSTSYEAHEVLRRRDVDQPSTSTVALAALHGRDINVPRTSYDALQAYRGRGRVIHRPPTSSDALAAFHGCGRVIDRPLKSGDALAALRGCGRDEDPPSTASKALTALGRRVADEPSTSFQAQPALRRRIADEPPTLFKKPAPKKFEDCEAKVVEDPVVEAPVVEDPVVEDPVVEDPVVEAPVVEAPVVEAPVVEAPVVEAPDVEARPVDDWVHCKLEWLKPDNIRDKQGRRPGDPEYNPSTLHVPQDFLNDQTPAHRQWWEMKATHYDCVIFFKVGKFYELYHMDAGVGVQELGLTYMRGEFAHSGFPEVAYGRMAVAIIAKGYKVARVEQVETPEMMAERLKNTRKSTKFDKVVRREICAVTMRGAQVCDLQDSGPCEPGACYMMALTEEECMGSSSYGVCFVDTSIGHFQLGQFEDDNHLSRLLTTLAHYPPAYIVYDRRATTALTTRLLSAHCACARREPLVFPAPESTLAELANKYYKRSDGGDWPAGLKPFLHQGDALGLTPAAGCSLAVKALGGCVTALTRCKLDIQVLGLSQFSRYAPPDVRNETLPQDEVVEAMWAGGRTMVLDSITLLNLRIVNSTDCLYDNMNSCVTAMGKRLLYQWVCSPGCNVTAVKERQEAVKLLVEDQELARTARAIMAKLPDFERLLAKLHALGNAMRASQHPDSRAIFYEDHAYSKRTVLDFMAVLDGLSAALGLAEAFSATTSQLLRRLTQLAPEGKFPDYRSTLNFFAEGINAKEARDHGRILPGEGVDEQYDAALEELRSVDEDSREYLNLQERQLRCRLRYIEHSKRRFHIVVPKNAVIKITSEYHLEGTAAKGDMRYTTQKTKEFAARLSTAEEAKTNALKDVSRRVFQKFTSHYDEWTAAAASCATLDVLIALADFSRLQTGNICLPEITFNKDKTPYIDISEGRHPCISVVDDYIPNDTSLGENGSLLLLTGPNMGGKSTLMRQLALLTVLAQLGTYVPAAACRLSLVDRIFTRLGACDDIIAGQSTFLVELKEAAVITKHATRHSLVLVDELGRGTSTYDGACIAGGVCDQLARLGCRTVFATHYHTLVRDFEPNPAVVLGHMACMVENEGDDDDDEVPEERLVLLYKLRAGGCPRSYGFNAARRGGVARATVRRARELAASVAMETRCSATFKRMFEANLEPAAMRAIMSEFSFSDY